MFAQKVTEVVIDIQPLIILTNPQCTENPRLQLRLSQSSTVKPSPLIILFRYCQRWQFIGHDPSWTGPGDNRVLGEIRYTIIIAQEIFV